MMEDGYYPVSEQTHIQFGLDDNIAVVEYEEGILAVRLFFSIEEEACDLFMEASNSMMMCSHSVKAVVLDDMKNITGKESNLTMQALMGTLVMLMARKGVEAR